jgi:hypothetical protein
MPLVALGCSADQLPTREGVQAAGEPGRLTQLEPAEVLRALGLG